MNVRTVAVAATALALASGAGAQGTMNRGSA